MNTQGIGLGLVIADQIVAQFNGTIKFKSKIDVGSTFTFNFKLEEGNLSQESIPQVQEFDVLCNDRAISFNW